MNHPSPVLPHLADYPSSMFAVLARSNADPRSRERRSFALGICLSILIHALLLFITVQYKLDPTIDSGAPHQPISVRLAQRGSPAPKVAPPPEPHKDSPRPRIITVPRHASRNAPIVQSEPTPAKPQIDEPMDMSAMVNAARQRRQQAEDVAARENAEAAAGSQGPSANDIATANIQRSLNSKRDGTGGVFQILNKGVRSATFAFRGWAPGSRNSTYQTFEVDAGLGGNVELAIVRRMIELIRTHYTGDFNWESHRLGRVIVKSARPQDNAELEAFLMKEFFGDEQTARAY